jgi:hypothetical protein
MSRTTGIASFILPPGIVGRVIVSVAVCAFSGFNLQVDDRGKATFAYEPEEGFGEIGALVYVYPKGDEVPKGAKHVGDFTRAGRDFSVAIDFPSKCRILIG